MSKYAITSGVYRAEGTLSEDGKRFYETAQTWFAHRVGKEAFRDREEALRDAEIRRQRRLKSLRAQIKKLRELKFE